MSSRSERARALQGKRAGFPSRIVAAAVDIGLVFVAYEIILVSIGFVRFLLTEKPFTIPTAPPWLSGVVLALLIIAVLSIAWSGSGRTLGNAAIGLRVVNDRGTRVTFPRAVVRAAVLVLLPFPSMGWILVSRKNAGLHDLAARTAVVYDWRPRHERVRGPDTTPASPDASPASPAPGALADPAESRQN
jgi:uncharacterized RDD family membrane protein YckC